MGYLLCPLCCGRSFSNRKSLQYHLLASESNISCPECREQFETIVDLANHLELETCEQRAVVISIPAERVGGHVSAVSSSAMSRESSTMARPSKPKTSVNKYHRNAGRSIPLKQKVVYSPQSKTDDPDDSIVSADGNPTDETTDYEVVMSDALDVSHDFDAIQQWEQQVPDEVTEHFCNSCNCKVQGVLEHINKYHPTETVILQNAEVVDSGMVESETQLDVEDECENPCDSLSSAVQPQGESEQEVNVKDVKINPATRGCDVRTNANIHKGKVPTSVSKKVDDPSSNNALKKNKDKGRLPKVYGTVDQSNMVDAKTGIPYVRRIVHIEKFWEKESFKLSLSDDADESDTSESDGAETQPGARGRHGRMSTSNKRKTLGRKRDATKSTHVATPVVKVPPKLKKPTLVQAHISQILRSGALDTLKQSLVDSNSTVQSNEYILERLLTAANTHEAGYEPNEVLGEGKSSRSSSPSNLPLKIKEENDSSINKFKSESGDPLGEEGTSVFHCIMCNVEFSDPQRFATHKCKPVLPTICDICGVKCKSNRNLRIHMEVHDPKSKAIRLFEKQVQKLLSEPATCDICNTEFTTAGGLKVHKRMHRPDNVKKVAEMNNKVEYRCDLCNMVCYSERTYRIHYKVHLNCQQATVSGQATPPLSGPSTRDLGLLNCKLCNESFTSNEELKTHWQAHYPEGEKSTVIAAEETVISVQDDVEEDDGEFFTCQQCGKRLAESLREIHEKMHRGDPQFGCSVCNKHFTSETNLEFHMATHRTDVELECLTCKTKFTDAGLLRLHRKTHAGADRPYPCGFCGRRFSRPHEKVKHERIHTGEKPYECAICGMRFRVGYCLKMHERIHTGVRPYSCEHCGKTFRARSGYKQHIRLHSEVRAFVCPFCPKTFKTVVQLAGHKKSHTKPYSCPHCGRRFATMYMVRAHVNTHAKSNLKHCCYICGASYGRDYALKDHIKSHGKNVPPPPDNEEEMILELEGDLSNDTHT